MLSIPEQVEGSGDVSNANPSWLKGSEKKRDHWKRESRESGAANRGHDTGNIKVEVVKAELRKEKVVTLQCYALLIH